MMGKEVERENERQRNMSYSTLAAKLVLYFTKNDSPGVSWLFCCYSNPYWHSSKAVVYPALLHPAFLLDL